MNGLGLAGAGDRGEPGRFRGAHTDDVGQDGVDRTARLGKAGSREQGGQSLGERHEVRAQVGQARLPQDRGQPRVAQGRRPEGPGGLRDGGAPVGAVGRPAGTRSRRRPRPRPAPSARPWSPRAGTGGRAGVQRAPSLRMLSASMPSASSMAIASPTIAARLSAGWSGAGSPGPYRRNGDRFRPWPSSDILLGASLVRTPFAFSVHDGSCEHCAPVRTVFALKEQRAQPKGNPLWKPATPAAGGSSSCCA